MPRARPTVLIGRAQARLGVHASAPATGGSAVAVRYPLATGLLVAASLLLALPVAVLVNDRPAWALPLLAAGVLAFSPRSARATLVGIVAIAPTFNPALAGAGAGAGAGRVYIAQLVLIGVFVSALVVAAGNGMHVEVVSVLTATILLVAVETFGRETAGLAWVYRPLQVFFVAFSVQALLRDRDRWQRRFTLALAWGATVGCALGSLHALIPAIDPFRLTRPQDIPFVSAIGGFARATGAFTYPNNLGTFAAYAVLLGMAAWLLERPSLPRGLSRALMATGTTALLLAGSRAAGVGLLCGIVYLTIKASPRRRGLLLAVEALVGVAVILAVLSSPTAREVTAQRLESAAGESLSLRVEDWSTSLRAFRASPLVGAGASESRTDNFWLLYLAEGGLAGAALLWWLARTTFGIGRPRARGLPELWVALLIAICVSGLLQDSLGQTLVTWFPGALLGLCVVRRHERAPASARSEHG